jgi:hypothetical protein
LTQLDMGTAAGPGRIYVYLGGPTGSWLTSGIRTDSPDATAGGQFGAALHVCGDTDGNGIADTIVGAWAQGSALAGRGYLYRGTGAPIITFDAPDGAGGKLGLAVY